MRLWICVGVCVTTHQCACPSIGTATRKIIKSRKTFYQPFFEDNDQVLLFYRIKKKTTVKTYDVLKFNLVLGKTKKCGAKLRVKPKILDLRRRKTTKKTSFILNQPFHYFTTFYFIFR